MSADTSTATPILTTTTPNRLRRKRSSFRAASEVAKLAPGDHSDRLTRGLVLRVHPSGGRAFRWRIRAERRTVTLGEWAAEPQPGRLTLAQAREWHDRLRVAQRAGQLAAVLADLDAQLGRNRPAPGPALAPATVADVAEDFYNRRLQPHRKDPTAARRLLDREIVPVLGPRPIAEVETREVARLVEAIVDRGSTFTGQKVLALVKQMFRFAEGRGIVKRNPAAPLDPDDLGIRARMRQRALAAEEVPILWHLLDTTRTDPRSVNHHKAVESKGLRLALKILLLCGARVGEPCKARWANVDLDRATWTIPVADQKGTLRHAEAARPFVIPLAPSALALFRDLKAFAGEGASFVLPSPWSSAGHVTIHAPWTLLTRLLAETPLPGGPITVHDLRRTCRTMLSRLGVAPHVAERALNHALPALWNVYDLHDHLAARREALEKLDAYVARLVSSESAEVVTLPQPSAAP